MNADETRDELARTIAEVTDQWDEPLDEVRDIPQIVNALLAYGLIPVGTTTEQWGFRFGDRPEVHIHDVYDEDYVRSKADPEHGLRAYRRTRTTYTDRVTDWEEVQ